MPVFILASAEQDLKELRNYIISRFSHEQWTESLTQIRQVILMLQKYPQAGTVPLELADIGGSQYRQILSGKNRIIYELRPPDVFVHIIVDARKDMHSLLTTRLLRP